MDHGLFVEIHADQFNAVFDMLSEAVNSCPKDLWDDRTFGPPVWQLAYHALDSLEFYMGANPDSHRTRRFAAPDSDLANTPGAPPSREEFFEYIQSVRERFSEFLHGMSPEELNSPNAFPWTGRTTAHRLTYNVRHLQHHMGAINLILANSDTAQSVPWH